MKKALSTAIISVLLGTAPMAGCDAVMSSDARVKRAEASLEKGDYESALEDLKKAIESDPDNAQARLLLARASLEVGDPGTAETELARAEAGGADAASAQQLKIDTLLAQGRTEEAEAALDSATAVPEPERAVREGRIKLAQAEPAEAVIEFEKAAAAGSLEGRLGSVDALVAQGRLAEAREILERILADHPASGQAWLSRGLLDAREGRYTDSADALSKAIDHQADLSLPERIQAHAARVEVLINAGDLEAAGRAQSDLAKLAAGAPVTLVSGARLALARGEPAAAVDRLQKVVQVIPNQPQLRSMLVAALVSQGSMEQALAEAGRLAGDFPESEMAVLTLARTQLQANRPDAASATLRPLIEAPVPSPAALSLAAQIEMRRGRAGGGVELLARGVEANPANVPLKIELAVAYVAAGRADDAVELLQSIPDGSFTAQRDRLMVIAIAATQDASAARAEIEQVLKANPDDVALANLSASYFTSVGDIDRARALLDGALEKAPNDRRTLLALARLDFRAGNMDSASSRVQELLRSDPSDLAALGQMAEIAARRGDAAELERWLEEARRADPKAVAPRVQLARNALAEGNEDRFKQLVAELDRGGADNATVQMAVGALYGERGRNQEAIQRFQRAKQLDPKLAEAYAGLGQVYLAEQRQDEARTELKRALELRPGYAAAANPLAMLEVQQGRLDEAMKVVEQWQALAPRSGAPWLLEGDVKMAARKPAEAARAYERSLEREPGTAAASRAANALRVAGIGSPERPLVEYLRERPSDFRARAMLANIYLTSGRNEEAIAEYERVVAAIPGDPISLNNLAWLYGEKKDPRALETAKTAYELAPNSASIADTYAWLLVQAGETRRGLEILSQVADKAGRNLEIQYHYAYALKAEGQADKAREVLRKALSATNGQSTPEAAALLRELGG